MSDASIEIVCWFSGRVQGVGFRWRTERLLGNTGLDGYVRNLADGRVELRLQGPRASVEESIETVASALAANIASIEREERAIEVALGPFRIERST